LTGKCFPLTGKCFPLTTFPNSKQTQESLESKNYFSGNKYILSYFQTSLHVNNISTERIKFDCS
jgi:hypothetical protein